MSSDDEARWTPSKDWGYVIFFLMLGTAVGNMFMAGKIKNLMKMNIPKAESQQQRQQQTRDYQNMFKEKFTKDKTSQHAFHCANTPSKSFPDWLISDPTMPQHLKTLNLWPVTTSYAAFLPELKVSFRTLAKDHHPDLLPPEVDRQTRARYSKRFQEVSASYQALLSRVKLHDQNFNSNE
jgi:hypothetical protein